MTKKNLGGMLYVTECIWKGASLCKGQTFTDASIGIEHPAGLYFQLQKECTMQVRTIKNPNRSGQPRKSVAVRKSHKITIKLSMPEYYALKGRAREAGLNRSEYIRQCFVKSEVKQRLSPEHLDYIRKLSGMANNLNQLAHRANAAGYHEAYRLNMTMAEEIDNLIKQITHDS